MLLKNYVSACVQMSNNHDNDKIFNDYMSGDSEISRRYRDESNEEPPKHLIDATQNLIEKMMDADMEMAAKNPRKEWYVPLSIAASFVICAGVVLSVLRTSDESIVINQEMLVDYYVEKQVYVEEQVIEKRIVLETVEELVEEQVIAQEQLIISAAEQESVEVVAEIAMMLSVPVAQDSGLTKEMEDEIRHRNREELEQFELDSLRMVGTVEDEDNQWGIIKSPDGVIHRIKVGNYMGRNTGKVLNVFEGRIEVREIVRNSQGRWEERQTGIALSDDYDAEEIKSRQK